MTIPTRITAARLYVDGSPDPAVCEIDLPEPEFGSEDVGSMAISGEVQTTDAADLRPMTATVKGRGLSAAFRKLLRPGASREVQVRYVYDDLDPSTRQTTKRKLVADLLVQGKKGKQPTVKRKQGDMVEVELAVQYYKLAVDGETVHELDPLNRVCVIDGEDLLADERAFL